MALNLNFKIETYNAIASTQDLMRERIANDINVHGFVIRALQQSGARGQRRRDWLSNFGGSYQTLAVKDTAEKSLNKPHAAIAIALGLAQTFPEYGIQVGIKWPNDLHYPHPSKQKAKKVAGILCEYFKGYLLIGIGVNVNNEVEEPATALRGLDTEGVSNFVLAGMQKGLDMLVNQEDIRTSYADYDVLKNKKVSLILNGEAIEGIAQGINKQGCLKVQIGQSERTICHSSARSSLQILD